MDRAVFAEHFVAAAKIARDFARRYLEEQLPNEMIFRVHLNALRRFAEQRPGFKCWPNLKL